MYLLVATAKSDEEKQTVRTARSSCPISQQQSRFISQFCFVFQVKEHVKILVQNRIRSACTNDTLLHLSVSRLNIIKSGYFNDSTPLGVSSMT